MHLESGNTTILYNISRFIYSYLHVTNSCTWRIQTISIDVSLHHCIHLTQEQNICRQQHNKQLIEITASASCPAHELTDRRFGNTSWHIRKLSSYQIYTLYYSDCSSHSSIELHSGHTKIRRHHGTHGTDFIGCRWGEGRAACRSIDPAVTT